MKTIIQQCKDYSFVILALGMCLGVLMVLASMLYSLLSLGLPGFSLDLFTQMTPVAGQKGGLANAIFGSLVITFLATCLALPIGILVASYLAEEKNKNRFVRLVRLLNDTLLSTPSIISGLFVYSILVKPMGHFSALAGAVALAFIALPMIIRGVENVLTILPDQLFEAAVALALPRWRIYLFIIYKAAKSGIFTTVLLTIARILGETAPLLFTTLNNQFWSTDVTQAMANLPVVIYQYAMSPYLEWQSLAWSGALLIAMIVVSMSVITRVFLLRDKEGH